MNFDYTRSRATAERLIARFGAPATLTKPGEADDSTYPPTPGTPTDYACTAVKTEYAMSDRDGSNVRMSDVKLLVSTEGLSVEPANNDTITVAGRVYSVVNVDPLEPGPLTVMWTVQGRSGE